MGKFRVRKNVNDTAVMLAASASGGWRILLETRSITIYRIVNPSGNVLVKPFGTKAIFRYTHIVRTIGLWHKRYW